MSKSLKIQKFIKKILILTIVVFILVFIAAKTAKAQTVVYFNPADIAVDLGNAYSVSLKITDVVEMFDILSLIYYDDSMLTFSSYELDPEYDDLFSYVNEPSVGTLDLYATALDFMNGITGNSTVVTLNFNTDQAGITELTYASNAIHDIYAGDITADWQTATATVNALADEIAPTNITDLAIAATTATMTTLTWTAPGDDADVGTAALYDIRYATSTISSSTWDSLLYTQATTTPQVASSTEIYEITGLDEDTTYYFAIKTSDEIPNESGLSNIASTTTANETAPADITDLAAIIASTTVNSITLTWTAPGDDADVGTAALYDIRYATSTISSSTWDSLLYTQATTTPQVASSTEIYEITGLDEDTTYYFAIKTSDEASNESGLSNIISATTDTSPTPEPYCGDGSCNGSETCSSCSADCGSCGGGGGGGYVPSDNIAPQDIFQLGYQTASSTENPSITLSWKNPSSNDLSGIMILRRTDKYPISVNDGTAKQIYKQSGAKDEFQNFTDEDVIAGATYYYMIYAYDRSNNYASGIRIIITAAASIQYNQLQNQQINDKLIKSDSDNKIYIIKESEKYWIPSEAIFNSYEYNWDDIIVISQSELDFYGSGGSISLAENSLVISDLGPRVYIVKNNKIHWIPSEAIFNSHEYEWNKILKISNSLILSYEVGADIGMLDIFEDEIVIEPDKPIFAYNKPRLPSLEEEQRLALELRQKLENNYSKEQLKGIDAHNWHTITNSYIYGEYFVEAIVKAIKFGGKTVHPDIPYSVWKNAKDYLNYIDR